MPRAIIVGDVHGCRRELEELLAKASPAPSDQVVLVGDLVGKGPDPRVVVQLARELGAQAVLGNHDAHVLKICQGTLDRPPKRTHKEAAQSLEEADVAYLAALPPWLLLEELGVVVVHGGLLPGVPLPAQPKETCLTLRSITPQGRPSARIEDGVPWASLWKGPPHAVFGHDAVRGLQQHPFATGLDTGCVYGGALTALVWPERRLLSVPAHRVYSDPGS